MDFSDKYISAGEKLLDPKSEKVVLSNDAYAIGEMIQNLIKQIAYSRKF